jgi:hypothetical protein
MSMLYIQIFSIVLALVFLAGTVIDNMRFGWFGKSLMNFYATMAQVFLSVFVFTLNIVFPKWQASSSLLTMLSFELAMLILLLSDRGEQRKQKKVSTRVPIIAILLSINFFEFHLAMCLFFMALILIVAWFLRLQQQYIWRSMLVAQIILLPTIFYSSVYLAKFNQFWVLLLALAHFVFLRRCINASLIKTMIADKIEQ